MAMSWKPVATAVVALATSAGAAGRYGDKTLAEGARDSDFAADYVTLLQTDLYELGYGSYLEKGDKTSGVFGTTTAAAVKAFQRDVGLPATGVVDAATADALAAALAGGRPPLPPPVAELNLLSSNQITIKSGQGKITLPVTPTQGKRYVVTATGEVAAIAVINPYGAYMNADPAGSEVVRALRERGDDAEVAVTFSAVSTAGTYLLEVEAINDLKDVPVTVNFYELAR